MVYTDVYTDVVSPSSSHSFKNFATAVCNRLVLEHFLGPMQWSLDAGWSQSFPSRVLHHLAFASSLGHDFMVVEQVHSRAGEYRRFLPRLFVTGTLKMG